MKPRTKAEKEVVRLSRQMGELCKRDADRLVNNTYGTCAYEEMYDRTYAVVSQAKSDWQVLRYFRITRHRNVKREVSYELWEVMQIWLNKDKEVLLTRQRTLGLYIDTFLYSSPLEVRRMPKYGHNITQLPFDYLYHKTLSPFLGYVAEELCDIDDRFLLDVMRFVCKNPMGETIIKQSPELATELATMSTPPSTDLLTAIKIAFRHGFNISAHGFSRYADYISALTYLGKDVHNPYYACPSDFAAAHDRAIATMRKRRDEAEKRRKMERQKADNERYVSWRKKFFDMEITDGTISCKVLQSVKEFYEEGKAMHHCVYACDYYKKPYSLIMSARIDGKRIETIEVDLASYHIKQSYGACDKFTIYHERILNLVNSNMDIIKSYNNKQQTTLKVQAV